MAAVVPLNPRRRTPNSEELFLVGDAADGGRQGEKEARGRAGGQRIGWGKPLARTSAMAKARIAEDVGG